jgi:hypothetical protein
MSNVELFTNGDWRNTKLMVDGKLEKYVTSINIYIGDKSKAGIEVNKRSTGKIPYGSLVTVTGKRYREDESGHILDGMALDDFEYKNVNVYKLVA